MIFKNYYVLKSFMILSQRMHVLILNDKYPYVCVSHHKITKHHHIYVITEETH